MATSATSSRPRRPTPPRSRRTWCEACSSRQTPPSWRSPRATTPSSCTGAPASRVRQREAAAGVPISQCSAVRAPPPPNPRAAAPAAAQAGLRLVREEEHLQQVPHLLTSNLHRLAARAAQRAGVWHCRWAAGGGSGIIRCSAGHGSQGRCWGVCQLALQPARCAAAYWCCHDDMTEPAPLTPPPASSAQRSRRAPLLPRPSCPATPQAQCEELDGRAEALRQQLQAKDDRIRQLGIDLKRAKALTALTEVSWLGAAAAASLAGQAGFDCCTIRHPAGRQTAIESTACLPAVRRPTPSSTRWRWRR